MTSMSVFDMTLFISITMFYGTESNPLETFPDISHIQSECEKYLGMFPVEYCHGSEKCY